MRDYPFPRTTTKNMTFLHVLIERKHKMSRLCMEPLERVAGSTVAILQFSTCSGSDYTLALGEHVFMALFRTRTVVGYTVVSFLSSWVPPAAVGVSQFYNCKKAIEKTHVHMYACVPTCEWQCVCRDSIIGWLGWPCWPENSGALFVLEAKGRGHRRSLLTCSVFNADNLKCVQGAIICTAEISGRFSITCSLCSVMLHVIHEILRIRHTGALNSKGLHLEWLCCTAQWLAEVESSGTLREYIYIWQSEGNPHDDWPDVLVQRNRMRRKPWRLFSLFKR